MCPIKKIFHVYCPGCGGSRALAALLHLQVRQSLYYNPSILLLVFCAALFADAFLLEKRIASKRFTSSGARFRDLSGLFLRVRQGIIFFFLAFYIGYGIYRDYMLLVRHVDLLGDFF